MSRNLIGSDEHFIFIKGFSSEEILLRLAYLYYIFRVFRDKGMDSVHSKIISKALGVSPNKFKQYVNCVGLPASKMHGYEVEKGLDGLRSFFGLNKKWHILFIGFGNLTKALYFLLQETGFVPAGFFVSTIPTSVEWQEIPIYKYNKEMLREIAKQIDCNTVWITMDFDIKGDMEIIQKVVNEINELPEIEVIMTSLPYPIKTNKITYNWLPLADLLAFGMSIVYGGKPVGTFKI